jgi:calcineurin-like phosphoesterase family protein
MIFFTADLHAFHKNIIEYDNWKFNSLEEYRDFIIYTWNKTISSDDEVYLLGDTCVGGRTGDIKNFLWSLNGKIYLVKGNHEKEIMKVGHLKARFEWIKDYHVLDYEKQRLVLMHFPIEEWINKSHGSIHLHGHSHGNSRVVRNRIDVGFAACNGVIYNINEIINLKNKSNGNP